MQNYKERQGIFAPVDVDRDFESAQKLQESDNLQLESSENSSSSEMMSSDDSGTSSARNDHSPSNSHRSSPENSPGDKYMLSNNESPAILDK